MSSLAPQITTRGLKPLGQLRSSNARTVRPSPPKGKNNERELVAKAIHRDQEAFAQLYDRFVDKIYRYVFYRIGNRSDAEDLTAQVFVKAWEAIGKYKWTDRPFAAWLYRIAHNLMVDGYRAYHPAAPLEEITMVEDPEADVEDQVDTVLTGEMLKRGLTRLTRDQQQVIVLRFMEGYSTSQVAEIMGKQEGAVRTLQHRALVGLRVALAKETAAV